LKARNLAQVSINLTDYEQTPMHRVYEMVKREAQRYGAVPVGSEIVGLVPKKAIEMAADYFCNWKTFHLRKCLRTNWLRHFPVRRWKKSKMGSWRRWQGRLWTRWQSRRRLLAAAAFQHLPQRWPRHWARLVAGTFAQEKIASFARGQAF